jgi:polysaccharide export outer membrane protein
MHNREKRAGAGPSALRFLTAAAVASLLLGIGALAPRACAQQTEPPAAPATETPKADDTTKKETVPTIGRNSPTVIGDDSIDPNQPIKPSFLISVTVVGEPDPSGNYQVDSVGNVLIRYTGIQTPVMVKGLNVTAAADKIAAALKTYIKNPQVTVSIVAIPRPTVFVGGAVKSPGPVIISQDTTLIDLLSRVEWLETADLSQVRLTRHSKDANGEEKRNVTVLHVDQYIKVQLGQIPDEKQNPTLQDKDTIFVPFRLAHGNGVIAVGGEVVHPLTNINLRDNPPMTVREAINLAGGTTTGANRTAVSIRRVGADRPLLIDLEKAEQGDIVNNVELKPDDAIYVEKLENNAYINVDGGFVKPGKIVYDKRMTLTQVVGEVGGPLPYAKTKQGRIFRHPDGDPKHTQVICFNWGDIRNGKSGDIEMQPGDTLLIDPGQPSTTIKGLDFFNVMGALGNMIGIYNSVTGRYYNGLVP